MRKRTKAILFLFSVLALPKTVISLCTAKKLHKGKWNETLCERNRSIHKDKETKFFMLCFFHITIRVHVWRENTENNNNGKNSRSVQVSQQVRPHAKTPENVFQDVSLDVCHISQTQRSFFSPCYRNLSLKASSCTKRETFSHSQTVRRERIRLHWKLWILEEDLPANKHKRNIQHQRGK